MSAETGVALVVVACGSMTVRAAHGAGALPEGGLGFDVGEERTGDGVEERVEVAFGRLRRRGVAGVDLADREASDSGFSYGPEERGGLVQRYRALGDGAEALGHARGECGVDGQRHVDVDAEERAGEGVEESGVDESVAGTESEAWDGEVDAIAADAFCERAEELRIAGGGGVVE